MLSTERYLLLYSKYAETEGSGKAIEVTLEQLSDTLYCTVRNVKLILRKLEEEALIKWVGGRGRGNRSHMTFLMDKEQKLIELAQQLARKEDYKIAFEMIELYGEGTNVRNVFVKWLNDHFGFRTVQVEDMALDILRLPVYKPILTLDPKETYFAFCTHMIKQLFDCLVKYDRVTGKVVPALAHAWEHDGEGKEWTFHLRKGILFHHGRELIADDVVYSLMRLHGSSPSGWFVRSIIQAEAVGIRTVKIELAQSNWLFPRFLCSSGLSIVPHDLVEQDEQFWQHPVGTGPFQFMEWTENHFTMQAYPNYFQGRAHLDRVVIVMMPEDTINYSKSWEQLLIDHDLNEFQPNKDRQKIESISNGCSLITWNMRKKGPQQFASFRKAVDLLIDRTLMIQQLGEDRILPARGFMPDTEASSWKDSCDVELATELLKSCNYEGESIRIGAFGIHEKDALWLKRHLAAFGINVEVQVETPENIRDLKVIQNVDCFIYCVVFAEDEVCFIELYEQTRSFLREHLDPHIRDWVKETIDKALACKSLEERWDYLMEIEKMLKDETYVLFLLHKKLNTFYYPNIRGVHVNSLGWIDFKDIWFEHSVG
ncbi:MAG: ABC transporter substrate-binding protein [Candidatus Pristimantibacillus sp.]